MPELQPVCPRCRSRHRVDLRCWSGKYAQRRTRLALIMHGQVCWMCGGLATEADHDPPRSLGGDDRLESLRPACRSCNGRRGNKENPFKPERPVRPTGVGLSARWRR